MIYHLVDVDLYNQTVTQSTVVDADSVVHAIAQHHGLKADEVVELQEYLDESKDRLKSTEGGWVLTGDELITIITELN